MRKTDHYLNSDSNGDDDVFFYDARTSLLLISKL